VDDPESNQESGTLSTTETSAFPSPLSIATPEGCEGWQEMYPYYALLGEDRRGATVVLELDALSRADAGV
jgi:hypothetical protein